MRIATGASHGCALAHDGTISCWGLNNAGQATPPTGIFEDVVASGQTTCALTSEGEAICWGAGLRDDDCGGAEDTSRVECGQAMAPGDARFRHLTVGTSHTCGLTTDNTVRCWGDNLHGACAVPVGFP